MKVIAGLGNPGKEYENTKHNVGFRVIDKIAEDNNISVNKLKFKAFIGEGTINGEKVMLVKPQTFMNLSGSSIREAVDFYKLDPAAELIVIYDDIALEPGYIRVRKKGSAGGHNGIKDIISQLGTQEFLRIRVGVGEKPKEYDLADYVLGHFSKEDREKVEEAMRNAAAAVKLMVQDETDAAMNLYNKKVVKEKE